jgi:mono/diheme cytochrome c family protein
VSSQARALAPVVLIATAIAATSVAAADLAAAKKNFSLFCASCHGETGHTDGFAAARLPDKQRDFSNCAAMKKFSDQTLFKVIKEGGAAAGMSSAMPPGEDLFKDNEVKDLVSYLRSFCKQ